MILILASGLRMVKSAVGARRPSPRARAVLSTTLLLTSLLTACASPSSEPAGRPLIVATTTIVGDIVSHVVGDAARVEVLMPVGVDAHEFTASSRQAADMAQADLIVSNGLGLEEGLTDVIDAAVADGVPLLEVGPLADPIPFSAHNGGSDAGTGPDPHFWMDPIRVGRAALGLADSLGERFPDVDWQTRASAYSSAMDAANARVEEILTPVAEPDRKMVTNHEAFGYFADRYGFRIVGAVIPGGSTLAAPSAADLADLVAKMTEEDTRVIFAETTQPTALAEAVASELGEPVSVVLLYTESLGEPGTDAEDLAGMLETNATRIAEALK
ncbi:MAG: metal ABC transporter substrate-binding protein [Acidimicrobiia bacterium]